MKGEFVISSFSINNVITVQAKLDTTHAVVNGNAKKPIRTILKAVVIVFLKKKGFVFAEPDVIDRFNRGSKKESAAADRKRKIEEGKSNPDAAGSAFRKINNFKKGVLL